MISTLTRQVLAPGLALGVAVAMSGCVQIPNKYEINLNVKIDQTVRYKIEKDLENAIAANPDLF